MTDDDRELRELFARLRQEDRARLPAFPTLQTRRGRRSAWSPRLMVAAAAIVLIAVVLARPDKTPRMVSVDDVELGAVVWRSPTDFLLTTPGSELLRTVPTVGSPEGWTPIDARGRRSLTPESTRSERTPS